MFDVVCDSVYCGGVVCKVEYLILCCFGILVTDRRTDERTDICTSRVAVATENWASVLFGLWRAVFLMIFF